jgi:ABC-type amino acid transport substrate-binding protein
MQWTFAKIAVTLVTLLLSAQTWAQAPVRINWTRRHRRAKRHVQWRSKKDCSRKTVWTSSCCISLRARAASRRFSRAKLAFSYMDGSNLTQANLKGANIALVAGATNRQVFSLMSKPEIKRVADLRGKKIGITRIGSSTHTSALYALNSAGLKQNDYQILPLVEVPTILTALIAGQVDAGVVSPPTNSRARKAA